MMLPSLWLMVIRAAFSELGQTVITSISVGTTHGLASSGRTDAMIHGADDRGKRKLRPLAFELLHAFLEKPILHLLEVPARYHDIEVSGPEVLSVVLHDGLGVQVAVPVQQSSRNRPNHAGPRSIEHTDEIQEVAFRNEREKDVLERRLACAPCSVPRVSAGPRYRHDGGPIAYEKDETKEFRRRENLHPRC